MAKIKFRNFLLQQYGGKLRTICNRAECGHSRSYRTCPLGRVTESMFLKGEGQEVGRGGQEVGRGGQEVGGGGQGFDFDFDRAGRLKVS
jgi:hypothetical protein